MVSIYTVYIYNKVDKVEYIKWEMLRNFDNIKIY